MKKIIPFLILVLLISCSKNNDITVNPVSVQFSFSHNWQETEVTSADFNDLKFTNENGETLSIERLRYVVSDIVFTHESGVVTTFNEHKLIDVTNDDLSFSTTNQLLPGNYTSVTIRFGLGDDYNIDGAYTDLNSANFNVPSLLGGGYHYMQFDGTYLDSNSQEQPFNYHAIRAVSITDPNNPVFQDTSFTISLGSVVVGENTTIKINADLYEWFSNPNLWDLNVLNTVLMPIFDAQVMMSANGATVFSLDQVTQ